jgi:glycosyltransferase involved in cell wall biosynthesis
MAHDIPDITAVLCTYNRADRVVGAVRAILDQTGCEFEVVVVDDGSTDQTPEVLSAIAHPRLRVVRRPNGGLSAARNSGLEAARGRWVTFIDDDDLAEPGWLVGFVAQAADPTVAVACCGIRFVDDAGKELSTHRPGPLGEPFPPVVASWMAGSFAVRADVLREAGGYLTGLGTRHQTELFIRLLATVDAAGLRVSSADNLGLRIELRDAVDRPVVNPRRLYDGIRWILARHPTTFAGKRRGVALYEGVVGTNAARLGDWRAARRRFRRSLRADPRAPGAWGRLVLAAVPAAGDRVWHRHGTWSTHDAGEIGILSQHEPVDGAPRELFLSWGYKENPAPPAGAAPPARPVAPARAFAARLARRRRWGPVVEVGHGPPGTTPGTTPGAALRAASGTAPDTTPGPAPGLTLLIGALERADDPVALLRLAAEVARGGPVLVATPDRDRSDPGRPDGPPSDPAHRREWSRDQLELLLLSTGFDVVRTWHVPAARGSRRRTMLVVHARARRVTRTA